MSSKASMGFSNNGDALSPGNLPLLTNIFFFMALIGLLVNWMSGDAGTVPGLSIVIFSLGCLLIIMLAGFSKINSQKPKPAMQVIIQFLMKGSPIIILMSLIGWYLTIYTKNSEYIVSKEMPDSWYTFSGLIGLILVVQLVQLYHFMSGLINKKNWTKNTPEALRDMYKSYTGSEGVFMMIFTVVMAWLVMIEYIIATYYRTDG
jgi:hypothetical protein